MDDPRFQCQCATFPDVSCDSRATQEDLLCDTCRSGCNAAIGEDPARHLKADSFHISFDARPARRLALLGA